MGRETQNNFSQVIVSWNFRVQLSQGLRHYYCDVCNGTWLLVKLATLSLSCKSCAHDFHPTSLPSLPSKGMWACFCKPYFLFLFIQNTEFISPVLANWNWNQLSCWFCAFLTGVWFLPRSSTVCFMNKNTTISEIGVTHHSLLVWMQVSGAVELNECVAGISSLISST